MKSLKTVIADSRIEKVPAGWYRAITFARANGYATTGGQFSQVLAEAIKARLVRRKSFRIKTARGVYPTPHYLRVK
jgi:hypothetical protein